MTQVVPTDHIDLSIVVVNYNSSVYLAGFLDTLLAQPIRWRGQALQLEVIVIENASPSEDQRALEALKRPVVRFLRNTENLGYALANNQGLALARGRYHLVANPDVRCGQGCITALLEKLESLPGAAIVGPLATMDHQGEVLLPPNELPNPYNENVTTLAKVYQGLGRFNMRRRTRYAFDYWTAREPMRIPMLSGAFFLARRSTFLEHGLFDPGYPLYYEDTDLFRRYFERGLGLWHVPEATIVHHFSRSTLTRMKAAMYRNDVGARRYFRTHFGAAGLRSHQVAKERFEASGRAHIGPISFEDLAPSPDCPPLPVPEGDGVYLEIAGNPQFTLAVGIFPGRSGEYRLPSSFWDELGPNRYWCRAVDPSTFDTAAAWTINKSLGT